MARLNDVTISDDAARFMEAQVAAGRFRSVDDALTAAVEALQERDGLAADRAARLRAAWEEGVESLQRHGSQLESDADFEAFLDECEADTARR